MLSLILSAAVALQAAPPQAPPATHDCQFCRWLNAIRRQAGVAPVGHDGALDAAAAQNNRHQAARGLGHWHLGPARRQNSGVGPFDAVCRAWLASPAHYGALVDPSLRWIGIAGSGVWWTFAGR